MIMEFKNTAYVKLVLQFLITKFAVVLSQCLYLPQMAESDYLYGYFIFRGILNVLIQSKHMYFMKEEFAFPFQ